MKRLLARPFRIGRALARRTDEERGQAAFEFLLILPLFIFFILMLVDFGIVMYGYVSVANASREGARYAAVNCGDGSCSATEVATWTRDHAAGFLPTASPPLATVAVQWSAVARGSNVSVQATRYHEMLFFPTTIPITSCTNMRLEQTDTGTALGTFGAGC